MLHTKFQAHEPSGSEEEKFLNIFLLIFMVQIKDLVAILNPGTTIWKKNVYGQLINATYQISSNWA